MSSGGELNVIVLIKHVIDVELNVRVRDGSVVEDGMTYVLSKWDENAIEAALVLKDAHDGEVTAVTIGPERSGESLRKALAMGVDKGVHINDPATEGSDSMGYARILAKTVARQPYDLILAGRQSQDTDQGGTGPMLAEMLGIPLVGNVVEIAAVDGTKRTAHRNGDAGKEVVEVTLPALLTANDSLNEPRLASLRGIMAAKKKELRHVAAPPAVDRQTIMALYVPEKGKQTRMIEGPPAEAAKALIRLLREEARAIEGE